MQVYDIITTILGWVAVGY